MKKGKNFYTIKFSDSDGSISRKIWGDGSPSWNKVLENFLYMLRGQGYIIPDEKMESLINVANEGIVEE